MRLNSILLTATLTAITAATPNLSAQSLVHDFQIVNDLRPHSGYLGVGIADMDPDRMSRLKLSEERGVEVTTVEEGSPADIGGIKAGDVLLTYNGERILGAQQFVRLVRETPASRKVRLSVWRNGKEQPLTVTTASLQPRLPRPDLETTFANFNGPDIRTLVVPDIPTIIMAWNSSSLGIECEPVDEQLAQYFGVRQGVLVRAVGRGTAAEKAGLRAGDVLTSLANHPVKTADDFRRILRSGAKLVPVTVMRDRKELTLNVALAPDQQQ